MSFVSKYQALLQRGDFDSPEMMRVMPAPVARSTQEKDKKHERMIREFANHFGYTAFDLTPEQGTHLVNFVIRLQWSNSTIDKCFLPSYRRLHAVHGTDDALFLRTFPVMRRAARAAKSPERRDIHPFILCDMYRLLRRSKPNIRDFSLLTFAMFTGMRKKSIADLTFGDLESRIAARRGRDKFMIVCVRSKKYKGGRKGPPLSMRGGLDSIDWGDMISVSNPVFWLEQWFKNGYGLSLRRPIPEKFRDRRIWGIRDSGVAALFKRYIIRLGYSKTNFCFHSLRKGMMANRLLLTPTSDPGRLLDTVSMIGNWSLNSKTRSSYVTDSVRRVQVCNEFGVTLFSPELMTVNGFHRTEFRDPEASTPMTTLGRDLHQCTVEGSTNTVADHDRLALTGGEAFLDKILHDLTTIEAFGQEPSNPPIECTVMDPDFLDVILEELEGVDFE